MSAGPVPEGWNPGDLAHFEYHCYEGEDSADAELWHRTHQQVTVISGPYSDPSFGPPAGTAAERADNGLPFTYTIRFTDGHEGDAWEDELLTSPEFFRRPDYSPRKSRQEVPPCTTTT